MEVGERVCVLVFQVCSHQPLRRCCTKRITNYRMTTIRSQSPPTERFMLCMAAGAFPIRTCLYLQVWQICCVLIVMNTRDVDKTHMLALLCYFCLPLWFIDK